jgi:hypothetical protein
MTISKPCIKNNVINFNLSIKITTHIHKSKIYLFSIPKIAFQWKFNLNVNNPLIQILKNPRQPYRSCTSTHCIFKLSRSFTFVQNRPFGTLQIFL